MKKILITTAISFLTLSVFFISCSKSHKNAILNQTKLDNTKNIRSEDIIFNSIAANIVNGVLTFKSIEDYKTIYEVENYTDLLSFANNVNNSTGFNSLYSVTTDSEQKDKLEFIGKLLNENSIIKIGEFLLLIDFEQGKVFAKTDGITSELISAKNGATLSNLLVFDIHDDVVEELQFKKTRGIFCKDKWGAAKSKTENLLTSLSELQDVTVLIPGSNGQTQTVQVGTTVSLDGCVKYWPAGIYFELNSRVEVIPALKPAGNHITAPFTFQTTYTAKRRCGNTVGSTSSYTTTNDNCEKRIMYWNVRALTTYSIECTFTSSGALPIGSSKTVSISN